MYWDNGCSAARNLKVNMGLLHCCTFGLKAANNAQNVRVDTARTNRIYQNDNVISQHITKSLQMSEDTNNPVYKLVTDKLQMVLIIVLIRTMFEH